MFSPRKICTSHKVFFTALFVFAAVGFARAARAPLELLTLDFPSAKATVAYGINANGDVVGTYVVVNPNGKLGVATSSGRFKEAIKPMDKASEAILALKPVTFRYKQPAPDGSKPLQYGLIAEEVADVYPDAVGYNAQGQPDYVEYHKINAMLLNEVQRQHREIEELKASVAELKAQVGSRPAK